MDRECWSEAHSRSIGDILAGAKQAPENKQLNLNNGHLKARKGPRNHSEKSTLHLTRTLKTGLSAKISWFRCLESSASSRRSTSQKSKDTRSKSPVQEQSNYRSDKRIKAERSLVFNIWNCILNPLLSRKCSFEIVNETLKILFNHYLPAIDRSSSWSSCKT